MSPADSSDMLSDTICPPTTLSGDWCFADDGVCVDFGPDVTTSSFISLSFGVFYCEEQWSIVV